MDIHFQMTRNDVIEFNRAFQAASPTFQRTRMRSRIIFPLIMILLWLITIWISKLNWTSTLIYLGAAFLWYSVFPSLYQRNVDKYCAKTIDEGSYSKNFGACKLSLSDSGINSISPSGTSNYTWKSIDRVTLDDTYLIIFLNGAAGYPIPIVDIGKEVSLEAYNYINQMIKRNDHSNL